MHRSSLRELPEFILSSVAYCDILTYKRNERSCFVLSKNLTFYEFRRKQMLHCIDLSETCLADQKQSIAHYEGRCSRFRRSGNGDALRFNEEQPFQVVFEKYIYKSFDASKLYLLLRCGHKLVALLHPNGTSTSDLRVVAEYENVENVKVVPSTMIKYQAVVKIELCNGNFSCTNFEESSASGSTSKGSDIAQHKSEFKLLIEKVRQAKSELQFHKAITQERFRYLKNKQTFGNNFLRSTRLDEKTMLGRCGDVWMRITSGDEVVVGLPLINNCMPPNLTILRNLTPILTSSSTDPIESRNLSSLHFEYRVYQLHQTFENLESLETFFQSEDSQFDESTWLQTEEQVLPSSFVVLVLKLRLSQIMFIDGTCELFVRFQIEKDLEMDEPKTLTFEQHLFIKTFDFHELLHRRQDYEINFCRKTLHKDFLALAMTSFESHLQIVFGSYSDRSKFEQLLAQKFDFEIVHREVTKCDNDDEYMETDDSFRNCKSHPCTLFYNRKPSSIWFGALIKRAYEVETDNDGETFQTDWTFYNKNEEKTFLMFKLFFSELMSLKCNVVNVKHGQHCLPMDTKICVFENAMRQEVSTFLDIINNENQDDDAVEKLKLLLRLQYNTDILAATHCHDII